MNLVQRDTVYNYMTFELLEAMINLSRINIDRFAQLGANDQLSRLMFSMTSFDTGRQTGKSTAISKYIKENDNAIVVSPNKHLKKDMSFRLKSAKGINNLTLSDFKSDSNTFRGLRGELDLIFDECELRDINNCLYHLNLHSGVKVRSIVKVGVR